MKPRTEMSPEERVRVVTEWRRTISRLVDEMETYYGPPGDNNQGSLDAAVHIAARFASEEVEFEERGVRGRLL